MGQASTASASANMLYLKLKQGRAGYTANRANKFGVIYDQEKRVSVLRNASDVITSMKKKTTAQRLRDVFLEKGEVKPDTKSKRNKKEPSVRDIGHRFISIATAASIVMGGIFITEQVIGIVDSAHASTELDKLHR